MSTKTATLQQIINVLETLAPLRYAESWDNVGLLVEPPVPAGLRVRALPGVPEEMDWRGRPIERVVLTIDLTEAVLDRAVQAGAGLIIAYHPTIFGGLKRLTGAVPLQRVVLQAIKHNVAIYSPHTALDATAGGVNDWLANGLGALDSCEPIQPFIQYGEPLPGVGAGRIAILEDAITLREMVARLKAYLEIEHLRVAAAPRHAAGQLLDHVALCPGAGTSLFTGLWGPQVYLTGEMSHHDILAKVADGSTVILTEHTNCERGYLPIMAEILRQSIPQLTCEVAANDRDPLQIW